MSSLQDAAKAARIEGTIISVRQWGESYGLPEPISLRTLIAPESVVFKAPQIEAGDVEGWARVALLSNGFLSFKGALHDNGDLYGDNYVLVFKGKQKDASGKVWAIKRENHIGNGENDVFQVDRHAPWIAKNWGLVKSGGWEWRINVDPSLSLEDLWEDIKKAWPYAIAILGAGAFASCAWSGGEISVEGTPEGGFDITCHKEL